VTFGFSERNAFLDHTTEVADLEPVPGDAVQILVVAIRISRDARATRMRASLLRGVREKNISKRGGRGHGTKRRKKMRERGKNRQGLTWPLSAQARARLLKMARVGIWALSMSRTSTFLPLHTCVKKGNYSVKIV
jgi:hypothetical protein